PKEQEGSPMECCVGLDCTARIEQHGIPMGGHQSISFVVSSSCGCTGAVQTQRKMEKSLQLRVDVRCSVDCRAHEHSTISRLRFYGAEPLRVSEMGTFRKLSRKKTFQRVYLLPGASVRGV